MIPRSLAAGACLLLIGTISAAQTGNAIQLGPRPFYLVDKMEDSALKKALLECRSGPFFKTDFSIGHRGAALQFPEHTRESYEAAARMGAGIVECDVTFTRDRRLVCRHSQCDLHSTTNILQTNLAHSCVEPFVPADPSRGQAASAKCCVSDITLAEFRTLCGKMDAVNPDATTVNEYVNGTAAWRTDLYSTCGTLMSHSDSVELFRDLDVKLIPELKKPSVSMPHEGTYTQENFAQQLVDELKALGVSANDVFLQSFSLEDIGYWNQHAPEFGKQAIFLDGRYRQAGFDPGAPEKLSPRMNELAASGVRTIAPPMWVLLTVEDGRIVPSNYARAARDAGLDIITWTLERSGRLVEDMKKNGGSAWYFQTTRDLIANDGDVMRVLDVLAKQVKVRAVFSDWPATTTYYANCMDLQ